MVEVRVGSEAEEGEVRPSLGGGEYTFGGDSQTADIICLSKFHGLYRSLMV